MVPEPSGYESDVQASEESDDSPGLSLAQLLELHGRVSRSALFGLPLQRLRAPPPPQPAFASVAAV